jgi:hypothetical protein
MNVTTSFINQLRPALSERDFAIIEQVGRFKLMTATQLERLFFHTYPDPDTGEPVPYSERSRSRGRQEVLRRLMHHRVLARVGERRLGGAVRGSASYVYMLDAAGQRIAALTSSQPRRPYVPYRPNQEHYLAVAELYVRLVEAERAHELRLLRFDPEPYCWRTFEGQMLKPDAFVKVGIEREGRRRRGSFFIEVDRAGQWGTKISSKLPQYVAYWTCEQACADGTGQSLFPQVLFLAPSEQRLRYLRGLVDGEREHRLLFRVELIDNATKAMQG